MYENKSDESKHVEAFIFTPEAINRKMFRRLTEEKLNFFFYNSLNFARLEENVSVPVSWEGKTEEHSMCVGDCIDSAKGVLCSLSTDTTSYSADTVSYGTDMVSYGSSDKKGLPGLCIVYCLQPPTLVYFAVLQLGLFSVYCPIHYTTTSTTFSELPQALY